MKGQILVIAIVFLAVILILTVALFSRVTSFLRFGANTVLREQATNLAEAGLEKALWQLNETTGAYSGETDTALGIGTFTTTIIEKSASLKTITATGYIPNAAAPRAKRTIKADALIGTQSIAFHYAVQVGNGGVEMENSSTINGNVYTNGNIQGSGSSRINGDAYAVGTISSPDPTVTGVKVPGAQPSQMPAIDYQFWKDAAAAGGTTTCLPTCTISSDTDIGPEKYVGDLSITNNAIATMKGPIYVTGTFSISQGGTKVKLDESFGSTGTVLITDGPISYTQGGTFIPTSANPKGYILIVTTSTANPAIRISQSGATAIFYALDGTAELSQSANVTSLVAGRLEMENSSTLNYDTGLAGSQFSSGPGGAWQIKRGTYRFTSSP